MKEDKFYIPRNFGLVILVLFLIFNTVYTKLKWVCLIHRTAARSPGTLRTNKTDIFNNQWVGEHEITDLGISQEFLLGSLIRNHYIGKLDFISDSFRFKEITIYSVDTNATIISAYAQMAGIYPASTGPKLSTNELQYSLPDIEIHNAEDTMVNLGNNVLPQRTQLFPVTLLPPENRFWGLTNPDYCKGVMPLFMDNIKTKGKALKEKLSHDLYPILNPIMNLPSNFFQKFNNTFHLCESVLMGTLAKKNFTILKAHNVSLTHLFNVCQNYLKDDLYFVKLYDPESMILRMSMSNILNIIAGDMENVVLADNYNLDYNNFDTKQFITYAGFTIDLGAFMAFLNIAFETKVYYPQPSHVLTIELYREDDAPKIATLEDYTVIINFNQHRLLEIDLATFKDVIKDLTFEGNKINDFCGFTYYSDLYYIIAVCILSVVFLLMGVFLISLLTKKPHGGTPPEGEVPDK